MKSTVTIFGELIETKIEHAKGSGYVALVCKYMDGKFKASYPAKSMGHAIQIQKSIIA